jgi:HSP20 family protein
VSGSHLSFISSDVGWEGKPQGLKESVEPEVSSGVAIIAKRRKIMRGLASVRQEKDPSPLKLVPANDLFKRMRETYESIAKRAFEIFEGNGRNFGREMEDWFKAETELLHPVHIEVSDQGDSLSVRAEVPGFTPKDLEVSVEPERLTIAGKREVREERRKEGKVIHSELCADGILRVVTLPTAVNTEKVRATLKDGILEFELPKAAAPQKIKIEPKAA